MIIKKVIEIDEEKCIGCGLCIMNCAEGAMAVIDGKAKLISDNLCDGIGNCISHCPQDALKLVERKVENGTQSSGCNQSGCPSSQSMVIEGDSASELRQWPVLLNVVKEDAPYLSGRGLLISSDCVPFAYPNFHQDLLKGNSVVVGCPKFDDVKFYTEKLTNIIRNNAITEVTVAHMEVPCCTGIVIAAETAIKESGKEIKLTRLRITRDGQKQEH